MAVEARTELIQTGESLAASEAGQIYGLPVEFIGFKNLSLVRVDLSDAGDVETLIPDFVYRPRDYQAYQAVCVLEDGQPIAALVQGETSRKMWDHDYYKYSKTGEKGYIAERLPIISIANLSVEPKKVILVSFETRPLGNIDGYWPGYALTWHEKNLKLGLETMLVEKRGEKFVISFPEGDAV